MHDWLADREEKLHAFFGLDPATQLLAPEVRDGFNVPPHFAAHLAHFNLEWHLVPLERAVPIDTNAYREQLYPMVKLEPQPHDYRKTDAYRAVINGHSRHQGRIIAVETTRKPRYLPGNRQFYGTPYGFDERLDPFATYFGRTSFLSGMRVVGTRFGHHYMSLRRLINLINEDWRAQSLMPPGFRLTICPPVVFNLIGTVFHPEWSETESLEVGFYRDEKDNAKCYAVGSNAPGDFSYIRAIETESDWTLLGFRPALVPE